MIFYFTGTGNSLYAAQTLAAEGEQVISVIDAVREQRFHYTLADNEPLGFVFPVYFYTVSDPVLELQRVDALVVPDGALIFYDIDTPDKMEKTLAAATDRLQAIKRAIGQRTPNRITGSAAAGKAGLAAYHLCMGTKKYRADDKCIHCGKCAAVCPVRAITMVDGRPVWTKDKCLKCCACINRCPAAAIQYGRKTEKRGRYVNPVLK